MADRLAYAEIDLQKYKQNILKVKEIVGDNVKVLAVVKANAYGHGIVNISEAAIDAGAEYLGIVSLGELKILRNAGIQSPVLIMNYLDNDSFEQAIDLNPTITIMDIQAAVALDEVVKTQNRNVKIHIKVDTGMHRAGCSPEDLVEIATFIDKSENLELEGLFTHFAESEALDGEYTKHQLDVFNGCIDSLERIGIKPEIIHAANSAAIIADSRTYFNMVRPGIITYGLNPFSADNDHHNYVDGKFHPVLSLKAKIIFIRELNVGDPVGYNRTWTAKRKSKIALLPIGYGDGFRRGPYHADGVVISGKICPIVGTVAMDHTMVDITDVRDAVRVGDVAEIIGENITADIEAKDMHTINYEVVTNLMERIERIYL